jgi:hypothetical protein
MALRHRGALLACALSLVPATAQAAGPAPIETVAGSGVAGTFIQPTGDRPGTSLLLNSVGGLSARVDDSSSQTLYFTDPADNRVFLLLPDGMVRTLSGDALNLNTTAPYGDGGDPLTARLAGPRGVSAHKGSFVIADTGHHVTRRAQTPAMGSPAINREAGQYNEPFQVIDDADALLGRFQDPVEVELWPTNFSDYYVADGPTVRHVHSGGALTTVAGTTSGSAPEEGGAATSGYIGSVLDIAVSADPDSYYVATNSNKVWAVSGGNISTAADVSVPSGVAAMNDGGVLIYEAGNARVRRLRPDKTLETIAGSGTAGGSPDGTPADVADLDDDGRLVLLDTGLFIAQQMPAGGGVVRRIPATAIIGGPSGLSSSPSATFTFGSWDADASFECKLDDAPDFGVCATATGLSDGSHTILVRATTDGATRVDPQGASRTWTVDATAPHEFALVAPEPKAAAPPQPDFTWAEATDDTTGVSRYELWIDGTKAGEPSCCSARAPAPLPDGEHRWEGRAVDGAGNARPSGERTFTVSAPPVAALSVAPSRALAGRTVSFDASASSDPNGSIVGYAWDLDGDGSFETDTGATAATSRTYASPATLDVKVRVTDSGGLTSVAQQTLVISAQAPAGKPLGVSINDGAQYTNDPEVTIFSAWPSFASNAFVSNDGGFKAGRLFPVAETIAWTLDSSGPERLPKTVYVRFQSGGQTSETYTDDIILDQTPPKVLSASLSSGGRITAAGAKVTLRLKARDNVSGVGGVQVTKNRRKPGRFLAYKKKLKVVPARTLYVRVRDRAGNLSAWRAARRR